MIQGYLCSSQVIAVPRLHSYMALLTRYGLSQKISMLILSPNLPSRALFYPDVDNDVLPAHVFIRSIHNISIERSWLRLRLDLGNNAVNVFRQGISDGIYDPNDPVQLYVFFTYFFHVRLRYLQ